MIIPGNMKTPGLTAFFTDCRTGVEMDLLSSYSGIPAERIYIPLQRHTDRVLVVDAGSPAAEADAVLAAGGDIMVGVKTADCLPILVYDGRKGVFGAVHAGWRGTAKGILPKTIRMMVDGFSCSVDDIVVAFGPSIRGCCYSVGDEVVSAVLSATTGGGFVRSRDGRRYVDLASANTVQALSAGVPAVNLWISGDCTCCLPGRYFSYRRSKTAKRQGGFIGLKRG